MGKFVRWYDKDKELGAFLGLLEGLDENIQSEVAMDIMLNIPTIVNGNLNDYINNSAQKAAINYRRWYDFNPTCHCAVETLRNLNKQQREIIIASTSDIILRSTREDFDFE